MEEILVELSTMTKLVPSLQSIAERLFQNATHHDCVIAVLILLMKESGFRLDRTVRQEPETQSVNWRPAEWRFSSDTRSYELKFTHDKYAEILDCKIVAIVMGDVLVVNLCPTGYTNAGVTKTRCLAIPTLKYVNPHSSTLEGRFMNLKELSHRFKDIAVTPIKGEILTSEGFTNASLCGLPVELKLRIFSMLKVREQGRISQTCREFRDLHREFPPLRVL